MLPSTESPPIAAPRYPVAPMSVNFNDDDDDDNQMDPPRVVRHSVAPLPPSDAPSSRTRTFLGFLEIAVDDAAAAARTAAVESLGAASDHGGAVTGLFSNPLVVGVIICIIFLVATIVTLSIVFSSGNFPDREQCIECITSARSNIWNESSARCVVNASASLKPEPGGPALVLDRGYCGKASCVFKAILPRVRPVPLWVLLLTSSVGVALSSLFQVFKLFGWKPLKKVCQQQEQQDEYDLMTTRDSRRVFILMNVAGAMNVYWFIFLYVFSLAHLGYLVWVFHVDNHEAFNRDLSQSAWGTFVASYATFINSGSTQILGVSFCQYAATLAVEHFVDHVVRSEKMASATLAPADASARRASSLVLRKVLSSVVFPWRRVELFVYVLAPLVPCTALLLPGAVIFAPVSISIVILWRLLCHVAGSPRFASITMIIVARIVGSFLVLIFFQTLSNYFVIYQNDSSAGWAASIEKEWASRDSECYINAVRNDVAYSWNLAGLFLS